MTDEENEIIQVQQEGVVYFTMVPHWLLDSGVRTASMRLYIALGVFANGASGACHPTRATVAKTAGMSLSAVKVAMADLEDHGVIQVTRRIAKSGGNTSNLYRMAFAQPFPVSPGQTPVD